MAELRDKQEDERKQERVRQRSHHVDQHCPIEIYCKSPCIIEDSVVAKYILKNG